MQTDERRHPALPAAGHEVLIDFTSLNQRIKSSLVGAVAGEFVLLKISPNDLIGTFRSEAIRESPAVIRYLVDNIVYRFDASVLNIVSNPSKLIFFTWPKEIKEVGPISERHECALPALTMLGNEIVEMTVIDISRGGCQGVIRTTGANERLCGLIHVNMSLDIKIRFPGSGSSRSMSGKIRNMSRDNERISLGIVFGQAAPEVREKLENFIALAETGE